MNWQKTFKSGLVFGVILAIMLSTLPMTGQVFAQDTAITVQVNGLLVYEQPNAASQLLAVMSLGSALTQVGTEVQNGFNKVRLPDGREGWAVLTVAGAPAGAATSGSGGGGSALVRALGNLRIRSEPSLNGSRIGGMGWGDQAYALAVDSTGKWLQVDFNGVVGWASLEWFEYISGNLGSISTTAATTVTTTTVSTTTTTTTTGTTPVAGGTLVESRGNVRLRSGPSLSSERLGYVPWGAVASLLAFDSTGAWVQIDYNGTVAWSAAEWWVLSSGSPASAPSSGGTAASSTSTASSGGGFDFILFNAPSDSAIAIRVVSSSTPFSVVNNNAGNGYVQVLLADGTDGFAKADALGGGSTATSSSTTTSATSSSAPASGTVVMALGNVRLRAEPSLSASRLTYMEWGAEVGALARTADNEWIQVNYNGTVGWAASTWFQFVSGSLAGLPVAQ